jgi:hypothetical protein
MRRIVPQGTDIRRGSRRGSKASSLGYDFGWEHPGNEAYDLDSVPVIGSARRPPGRSRRSRRALSGGSDRIARMAALRDAVAAPVADYCCATRV